MNSEPSNSTVTRTDRAPRQDDAERGADHSYVRYLVSWGEDDLDSWGDLWVFARENPDS